MFAVVFGKYRDACVKDQPKTVSLSEKIIRTNSYFSFTEQPSRDGL